MWHMKETELSLMQNETKAHAAHRFSHLFRWDMRWWHGLRKEEKRKEKKKKKSPDDPKRISFRRTALQTSLLILYHVINFKRPFNQQKSTPFALIFPTLPKCCTVWSRCGFPLRSDRATRKQHVNAYSCEIITVVALSTSCAGSRRNLAS